MNQYGDFPVALCLERLAAGLHSQQKSRMLQTIDGIPLRRWLKLFSTFLMDSLVCNIGPMFQPMKRKRLLHPKLRNLLVVFLVRSSKRLAALINRSR